MNFVPFTSVLWRAGTDGFQATPVNANPTGPKGLCVRTREWMRCGMALLILAGGLAVGPAGLRGASGPDSTIRLTATLVSPIDIALEWKDTSPDATGHTIEYATNPNGPFIILKFCPPSQTTYTHPKLMAQTTFYYRVRGIYGRATDPVVVTLPGKLSDAEYAAAYSKPEDYSWSGPKTLPDQTPVEKKSIRDAATVAEAAPTDLKATFVPVTVSGIQLTWTTHSSDEDGFLLEAKAKDSPEFDVIALIAPKINAFGWGLQPPARKGTFRIRAFYYGTPSNLETKTTVLPADWKNPPAKAATPPQAG
jgi:hypothetical protein